MDQRSFVALEIADEERAFEVAQRIAESTGCEVTVRDANWLEVITIRADKEHREALGLKARTPQLAAPLVSNGPKADMHQCGLEHRLPRAKRA
jgi:hypothetical protein